MLKLDEIKESIESLPEDEFSQFEQWFSEKYWQNWDEQIESDSESGKLDFLIEEALKEKEAMKLKYL